MMTTSSPSTGDSGGGVEGSTQLLGLVDECSRVTLPSLPPSPPLLAPRKLQSLGYDLRAWRADVLRKGARSDIQTGFDLMDAEGGAGWDLACRLVTYKPSDRCACMCICMQPGDLQT